MLFYLGTHMPHWLTFDDVPPLFVSHRRLARYRRALPRASGRWALDSGGFTELSMFGRWETTPAEYVAAVNRYRDEIGGMDWCAPQDWMCEPFMTTKTGLTVREHQALTVGSFLELAAAGLPVIPVLQGWELGDYLDCVDLYDSAGVDLTAFPTVGVGSVCRRQATDEIARILATLHGAGIRCHGFGVKGDGIRQYGWALTSADSMAWSYRGRNIRPCPHRGVTSCANCYRHALEWCDRVLRDVAGRPVQLAMI